MSGCTDADPYRLRRFVGAYEAVTKHAFAELERGRKESHWRWFVFLQRKGLGSNPNSQFYWITGKDVAPAYLDHSVLGGRLTEITQLIENSKSPSATEILGRPDDRKLQSCASLFHCVAPQEKGFFAVLEKFLSGRLN